MKRLKRICDFATGNAHTIVLIYAIVAVIVWVAVNLYFWKISFDLDREIREEMREYGDCYSDTDRGKIRETHNKVDRIHHFNSCCGDVVVYTSNRGGIDDI